MTTPRIDITGDECPTTFAKVKAGPQRIGPAGKLNVRWREGEVFPLGVEKNG